MIRIELDRIHLELLLLAGLFATFSGVVFQPMMQNGMNMTPLVAFGGVGIVGVGVLVHRRLSTGNADSRSRIRAMVWFALLGAVLGAAISSTVVETPRSMVLAAVGVGAMFSAFGTQFGIVIKSREEAAREAVETILDEKNVFVTPEQLWSNGADATNSTRESNYRSETLGFEATAESGFVSESEPESEATSEPESGTASEADATDWSSGTDGADEADETDDADDSDTDAETDGSTSEEQTDDTIDPTDDPGSKSWKQPADDTTPIPVIRSIESGEYPED